jgi:hypothetical protein
MHTKHIPYREIHRYIHKSVHSYTLTNKYKHTNTNKHIYFQKIYSNTHTLTYVHTFIHS